MQRGAAPRVAGADMGDLLTGQEVLQKLGIVPESRLGDGKAQMDGTDI